MIHHLSQAAFGISLTDLQHGVEVLQGSLKRAVFACIQDGADAVVDVYLDVVPLEVLLRREVETLVVLFAAGRCACVRMHIADHEQARPANTHDCTRAASS